MTTPDGMIAAFARIDGGRLASRNLPAFETTGVALILPWDFCGDKFVKRVSESVNRRNLRRIGELRCAYPPYSSNR
jgi:hypothetical protein